MAEMEGKVVWIQPEESSWTHVRITCPAGEDVRFSVTKVGDV